MQGYFGHIEDDTTNNTNFRKVIFTSTHLQLVLMTLQPGEDIGLETHEGHDQFFRFEAGEGEVRIDSQVYVVNDGDAVIVPSGSSHNVVNTGSVPLRFYTIYGPPEHADGTVHATRDEALSAHH